MEIQTPTMENILTWLQKHAAECKTSIIVHARIAVSPKEAQFLTLQPETPLEIIRY